jgi:hypothetical protein
MKGSNHKQKDVKTTTKTPAKRPAPAKARSARSAGPKRVGGRTSRSLHKKLLLHPFTVMVLLCAGVLIGGTTWRAIAAQNLDVTATVPAALPTAPASIGNPIAQQRFTSRNITVTGSCESQTYVKLSRNGVFAGVGQCASNEFQIQASLLRGANQLDAQVYNRTDQAGPTGTPVTVHFDETDEPVPAAPRTVPTTLWVENVEAGGYKQGTVQQTSQNPTVSGWAPPLSMMTITFHSDPETCLTQANEIGWWSCTLGAQLPPGVHRVDIKALTPAGEVLTMPTFQIQVRTALPNLLKPVPPGDPLIIRTDYTYLVRPGRQQTDLQVGVTGGTLPYSVTADWGDGGTTTLTRGDNAPFTLSHTYPTPSGGNRDYKVLVRATDAHGQAALMQLSVVVKGGGGFLLAANNTSMTAFLNGVQHWLWLIWPAYVVVVLMAIGYYLGEREEYQHLMAKRRSRAAKGAK